MPSSDLLGSAWIALVSANLAGPLRGQLDDLLNALPEGPARTAIVLGAGLAVTLAALLLLRSALRMRSGRARGRHRGVKVAPPRGQGARDRVRRWGQRSNARPLARTHTSTEEDASMRSPGTRSYLKVLQALREQSRAKGGLELPKRLFDLADALEQHAIGSAQDLRPFAGEAQQLLRFTVRVQPRPNSDGVAMRFLDGDLILGAADGPFRRESAQRFVEMTEHLQGELRTWLESLRAVLPASADGQAGDRDASLDPRAIPTFDAVPADAGDADADATSAAAEIDLSGLTPHVRVRRTGAARDPFGQRASDWTADPDRPAASGSGRAAFQDPLRWRDERTSAPEPVRAAVPSREPAHVEPTLDVPPLDAHVQPAPHVAPAPPDPLDLPPRLARAVEGIGALRDELDVDPPDGLQALERFFKHETLDRTSLLERVDRFVFTPIDRDALPAEDRDAPQVAHAVAWLRSEQAELVDELRERFGMHAHHAQVGEPFEPTHHVAVDTEAVAERARDRTVARAHSHGYTLELGRERRFLLRPKVTIFVMDDEPAQGTGAAPSAPRATTGTDGLMEVPVDSAYPGERDFSLTIYARWRVGTDLSAWLEVDGVRADFAHAEVVEASDTRSTVRLGGCDVPNGIRRGDGHLVLEDRTTGRTARHPFEVIT